MTFLGLPDPFFLCGTSRPSSFLAAAKVQVMSGRRIAAGPDDNLRCLHASFSIGYTRSFFFNCQLLYSFWWILRAHFVKTLKVRILDHFPLCHRWLWQRNWWFWQPAVSCQSADYLTLLFRRSSNTTFNNVAIAIEKTASNFLCRVIFLAATVQYLYCPSFPTHLIACWHSWL